MNNTDDEFADAVEETNSPSAKLIEQMQCEIDALREQMRENPWCGACRESDCLVSGDGTCAMIRKYLSLE